MWTCRSFVLHRSNITTNKVWNGGLVDHAFLDKNLHWINTVCVLISQYWKHGSVLFFAKKKKKSVISLEKIISLPSVGETCTCPVTTDAWLSGNAAGCEPVLQTQAVPNMWSCTLFWTWLPLPFIHSSCRERKFYLWYLSEKVPKVSFKYLELNLIFWWKEIICWK